MEIKYLTILLNVRRIRIHTSDLWIRILESQKHVDPVNPDPDPQHWQKEKNPGEKQQKAVRGGENDSGVGKEEGKVSEYTTVTTGHEG